MSKSTNVFVLVAVAVLILFGVVRGQTYALDTPTLTATEIDGKVVLSWFEVEGATRYDLQVWDCVNKWRPISENELQTTLAAHIDPADGITYLYTMQALNDRGEESDWAAISKNGNEYDFVRETVNPIPSPVFDVVAQADHIQLHFSNVEEAVGYQARVWYPGAGNRWLWLPEENLDLDSRTFSYTDVQPGVDYFFVMRSYSEDKCGFSDWSTYELHTFAGSGTGGIIGGGTTGGGTGNPGGGEATATPTATPNTGGPGPGVPDPGGPGPGTANTATHTATATATATSTGTPTATATPVLVPGSVSLSVVSNQNQSATSSQVQISWNHADPSADCYEVARHYYVIVSGGHRRNDVRGDTCTNSHTFTGQPASTHRIQVRGKSGNPSVYGPWSNELTIRLAPHPGSRPNAPTGVTAADVSNGVRISWTVDPSKTGHRLDEGDIYEHEIARKLSQAGRWNVIGTAGRTGPYVDSDVRPGRVYFYRVRSRNIHGYSPSGFTGAHTYAPSGPTPTPTPTPMPPTPTPTPTHDPCASVTCPGDPCNDPCNQQERDCGCAGCDDTCHCSYIHLDGVSTPLHLFLHEMMPYDDVYGVLFGIRWMEVQEKNKRVLRTHPYYVLNERHLLREHHAQHDK